MDFPKWEDGMLDFHHINTGSGNAAFCIFPDGTTMLIDAGETSESFRDSFLQKFKKVAPRRPTDTWTSGAAIANYIRQVGPKGLDGGLDYALITHFHADHFGDVDSKSKLSKSQKYHLSGITEVDEHLPIDVLYDRGYPDYNYPVNLDNCYKENATFCNYRKFLDAKGFGGKMKQELLKVGKSDQIILKKNAGKYEKQFNVRCVKRNQEAWTGDGEDVKELFDLETFRDYKWRKGFDENPLSIALLFNYGSFSYFTGGDMTGLQGYEKPEWYDTETPLTKAVGNVDVTTLNHHGNRDATNMNFVQNLQPQVVVQQAWCSDHPGMECYHRLVAPELYKLSNGTVPDLFSIYMHDNVIWTYGKTFVDSYKSMYGHVLVRVMPGGGEFYVFVLEDTTPEVTVKEKYGPYKSRSRKESRKRKIENSV